MRVAAVQTQPRLGDVEANLRACEPLVAAAAEAGARIVVLPEFFTMGMAYLPSMRTGTSPWHGAITEWLVEPQRQLGRLQYARHRPEDPA